MHALLRILLRRVNHCLLLFSLLFKLVPLQRVHSHNRGVLGDFGELLDAPFDDLFLLLLGLGQALLHLFELRLEVLIVSFLIRVHAIDLQVHLDLLRLHLLGSRAIQIPKLLLLCLLLVSNGIQQVLVHRELIVELVIIFTSSCSICLRFLDLLGAVCLGNLLDANDRLRLAFGWQVAVNLACLFDVLCTRLIGSLVHLGAGLASSIKSADSSLFPHGFELEMQPLWKILVIDLYVHHNILASCSSISLLCKYQLLLKNAGVDLRHQLVLYKSEELVALLLTASLHVLLWSTIATKDVPAELADGLSMLS